MASHSAGEYQVSGWGVGLTFVAGALLITSGMISIMYGASEIIFNTLGRATDDIVHIGLRGWGVIHLTVGIALFAAGLNIFAGKYWARMVGLVVSGLVLLAGLGSLHSSPVFGTFLVVLNLAILWALFFHWRDVKEIQ